MWKLHALRMGIIAVVFLLLYGFDALSAKGWFASMPVVMGILAVLLGLALSRRVEIAQQKKNRNRA